MNFKLTAPFQPTGDQPQAIEQLVTRIQQERKHQVLLGVTGSGKTYTMANCIARLNRPALIISHNKTLAAQLYQEFRDFFPENAVSYFVSYYDYYQPEAYVPQTDTYIEKETEINAEIDKLRLAATTNLLTRRDTIIVASVSCIYNIGSPREYGNYVLDLRLDIPLSREAIFSRLIDLQYTRADFGFHRGSFRVRGESIDLFPAYEDTAIRIEHNGKTVCALSRLDPMSGSVTQDLDRIVIYPAKHYMTDPKKHGEVFGQIRDDLAKQVEAFKRQGKILEAHRIEKRVNFDLEMIAEVGYVNGIENYSRYFDHRKPGDPPYSLLDYFKEPYGDDWLLFIDESHMTIPQIRGMYHGDRSRKQTLVDFGFRLPAALDNRPLTFSEFMRRIPQTIYVSATPDEWEVGMAKAEAGPSADGWKLEAGSILNPQASDTGIVEQLVRPTGLIDPRVSIRTTKGQIADLMKEIVERKKRGERVLVTTLTKRMAEDLSEYLSSFELMGTFLQSPLTVDDLPKVHYLHSDITTLDRSDILDDLRRGTYDVVIGINLLREGLDLPEVSLVAILDADKEGFLRSETSLIQTMGRAARHVSGQVIMYADTVTGSMKRAIDEVKRRRAIQLEYNKSHDITPQTIKKAIREKLVDREKINAEASRQELTVLLGESLDEEKTSQLLPDEKKKLISKLRKAMKQAAAELNFELAAQLRDRIHQLES